MTNKPHEWTEKQKKLLAAVKKDGESCVGIFKLAYDGSKATAVKAKCLECVWLDRSAITDCTASECPLWAVRPYQHRGYT